MLINDYHRGNNEKDKMDEHWMRALPMTIYFVIAILAFLLGILITCWYFYHKKNSFKLSSTSSNQRLPVAKVHVNGQISSASDSFLSIIFDFQSDSHKDMDFQHCLLEDDDHWWQQIVKADDFSFSSRLCHFVLPTLHRQVLVEVTKADDLLHRMIYLTDLSSFFRFSDYLKQMTEINLHSSNTAPFASLTTLSGRVVSFNQVFCKMFDVKSNQIYQKNWFDTLPEKNMVEINNVLIAHSDKTLFQFEMEFVNHSGRKFWCQIDVSKEKTKGTLAGITHWYFRDTTEGQAYSRHLQQAAVVFEASSDAILIINAKRRIKMINSAFTSMTGFTEADIIGRNPQILGAEQKDIKVLESIWHLIAESGSWQGEIWKRKKDGSKYPEWMSLTEVKSSSGKVTEYVLIASDMTQRKQAEDRIRYQANYDLLTNLPNRNLFMDRLQRAIARSVREETSMALLFIDLDRFKFINDSFGHSVGDNLLLSVARILESCVRMSDTIARFGGDEFAVILSPIYGEKNAARVALTILEKLNKPIELEGYEAVPSASIGICLYPKDGKNEEMLLKNADIAMYRAKEKGRNTYQFFTQEMQQQAQDRTTLEAELRAAIGDDQLYPVFQPQLDCHTGKTGGLEVLMRWNPVEGKAMVPPDIFIPLAEETGLIIPMGKWILEQSCIQYRKWWDQGVAPHYIAVNVSGAQFKDGGFVDLVDDILVKTGMNPNHLELELTESMLMEDHVYAVNILEKLHSRGIKLSIDDFGTGFSSLAYLKAFPMDNLKID